MRTDCRYCGHEAKPGCCYAAEFLKRAEDAEQRVKELLATIETLQEALRKEAARTAQGTDKPDHNPLAAAARQASSA